MESSIAGRVRVLTLVTSCSLKFEYNRSKYARRRPHVTGSTTAGQRASGTHITPGRPHPHQALAGRYAHRRPHRLFVSSMHISPQATPRPHQASFTTHQHDHNESLSHPHPTRPQAAVRPCEQHRNRLLSSPFSHRVFLMLVLSRIEMSRAESSLDTQRTLCEIPSLPSTSSPREAQSSADRALIRFGRAVGAVQRHPERSILAEPFQRERPLFFWILDSLLIPCIGDAHVRLLLYISSGVLDLVKTRSTRPLAVTSVVALSMHLIV